MNIVFKALDDATRRKILELLKDQDLTAGTISSYFDMTKPSISHHLDLLKQANLIASVRKGQYVYYSLNTTLLDEVLSWIIQLKK
jgi:DNA-binding transcriptional ArsR family regulator